MIESYGDLTKRFFFFLETVIPWESSSLYSFIWLLNWHFRNWFCIAEVILLGESLTTTCLSGGEREEEKRMITTATRRKVLGWWHLGQSAKEVPWVYLGRQQYKKARQRRTEREMRAPKGNLIYFKVWSREVPGWFSGGVSVWA